MNKHGTNNVIVKAISDNTTDGFDVVLVFSGIPEAVVHRSHDGMLYGLLNGGIRLGNLRRWRAQSAWDPSSRAPKRASRRLEHGVSRLLLSIDLYLATRSAVLSSFPKTAEDAA